VNFERDFNSILSADLIHVDVMDNNFVPNLTFGLPMVTRMQEITPLPLDVHLMLANADKWAPGYAECGAFSVTFHAEASDSPVELARKLRSIGARAGLAIKPNTPIQPYLELLAEFDQILIMTVEPGFGGQSLIESTLTKVSEARRKIDFEKLDIWLQVDGGITEQNIQRVAEHGADTFVAGSAVFKADDRNKQIEALRDLANLGISHRH
jgi:ribulose-phosphate 3-epimerase